MIKQTVLVLCVLLCASCASVQKDVLYTSTEDIVFSELEDLELRLVEVRAALQDGRQTQRAASGELRSISDELSALRGQASTEPVYRARILALSAEAALLSGDRNSAARFAEESRGMYAGDEINALVLSRLSANSNEAETLLRAAILASDNQNRIRAELAYVLERKGQYREALSLYDSVLSRLDPAYTTLYAASRGRSLALIDAGSAPDEESSAYLTDKPLQHIGMVIIARNESTLLDWYETRRFRNAAELFRSLKNDAWFSSDPQPNNIVQRQEAAEFLWRLVAQDNQTMLKRYTVRYAGRDGFTPVPDVPFDSPYFNAVLGTVEEGIMNLQDGRNFGAREVVSGLEFFGMLKKAEQWR